MLIRLCAIFLFSVFIAGCGGDDTSFFSKPAASSTSTTDSSTTTTEAKAVNLGILEGGVFTEGKIKLEFSAIKAFETASLQVSLVDEDGNKYTESASVSFTSICAQKSFASIISPVAAINSSVSSIYTANGCIGEDTITATTTINGKEITASAVIDVEAAVINSLRYASATPTSLGIKGFGQTEESTIVFTIIDREGRPVPNQSVSFSLNTAVGGISLYPETATSDELGAVKTVIHSGTTATNVQVTAVSDNNSAIRATSEVLTISTGVADQDSFSLSASVLNPNAGNYDGVEVGISVRAADHFNNFVPDGTKVYFTTEGGQIQPECEMKDGACSVKWYSSNPRPCYGRATILATMIGEESFIDANGNGLLDNNETFFDKNEAFRDDNEDGVYNELAEEFWDFNQNGVYDSADGKYNGVLCQPKDGKDSQCSENLKNIYARDSITLVMASDAARLRVYVQDATTGVYSAYNGSIAVPLVGVNVIVGVSGALASVSNRFDCASPHEQEILSDRLVILPTDGLPESTIPAGFQPMPSGTSVKVEVEKGELSPKSPELLLGSTNQSSPSYISFYLRPKDEEKIGAVSTVSITVESSGDGDIASKKDVLILSVNYPEGGLVDTDATTDTTTTDSGTDTTTATTPTVKVCAENVALNAGGSVFCVDSSPTSFVTAGQSYEMSNDNVIFTPRSIASSNNIRIDINGNIGFDSHDLSLSLDPVTGNPIAVGMYKNGSRSPFQAPTQPGLDFSGDGRGNNTLGGHFEVLEIEYDGAGVLTRLAVNFLQYSEKDLSKWTLGKVRFNSTIPLSVSSNFDAS